MGTSSERSTVEWMSKDHRLDARKNKSTTTIGANVSINQRTGCTGKEAAAVPAAGIAIPICGCGPLPIATP